MSTSISKRPRKSAGSTALAKAKAARPLSSPDKVVEAISSAILMRRFGPGHRLVEADLASNYNVSRGTVREALKKLAAQGVVLLSPHRGASIRPLSHREAQQLVLVLEVLCGLAARLAAENIGKGSARARMQEAADLLTRVHLESGADQFMADRATYYGVMLDVADNAELNRVMPLPQISLLRSQYHGFLGPKDIRDMRKEYGGIADAIIKGDAALAETRMRKHLSKTIDRLLAVDEKTFNQSF
ncbi:MAG: GntR family transcriptional regulator [Rhodocyclaceae bacterium]|jgi:DNA-binding GntR family transcriptional regulator|nr:GntR family transcriptional regulator [Rhodocyclaceae bacterium]